MPRRPTDPYPGFQFKLELGSLLVAGFSECSGLQMETKVFEYKEGGNNQTTLKFPEFTAYSNVTLKRGITDSDDLIDWQVDVVGGDFDRTQRRRAAEVLDPRGAAPTAGNALQPVSIVLMNEKGDEVKRWTLVNAFPVKWSGPDLKAGTSEVAVEALEIAHEGIVIQTPT